MDSLRFAVGQQGIFRKIFVGGRAVINGHDKISFSNKEAVALSHVEGGDFQVFRWRGKKERYSTEK